MHLFEFRRLCCCPKEPLVCRRPCNRITPCTGVLTLSERADMMPDLDRHVLSISSYSIQSLIRFQSRHLLYYDVHELKVADIARDSTAANIEVTHSIQAPVCRKRRSRETQSLSCPCHFPVDKEACFMMCGMSTHLCVFGIIYSSTSPASGQRAQ